MTSPAMKTPVNVPEIAPGTNDVAHDNLELAFTSKLKNDPHIALVPMIPAA